MNKLHFLIQKLEAQGNWYMADAMRRILNEAIKNARTTTSNKRSA